MTLESWLSCLSSGVHWVAQVYLKFSVSRHTVELYPIIQKFLVDTLKNVPKVILLTYFTVCENLGVKVTY